MIWKERKQTLVQDKDVPNNGEELAYLLGHYISEYLFVADKPDYTGALGAIELAKHELLELLAGRKK